MIVGYAVKSPQMARLVSEIFMKILSVKFDQPTDANECRFIAATDDCLPNGDKTFGGVLSHQDNYWKARADISTTWAAPANSGELAVQNCLTDAIKLFAELEAIRIRRDKDLELRQRYGVKIGVRPPPIVRITDVNPKQTDNLSVYRAVLSGLSNNEVRGFVGLMVEGFKRDDHASATVKQFWDLWEKK